METLLELLEKIKYYASWDDKDSKSELALYLDEIHGLVIDAIKIVKKSESIRLGITIDTPEDVRKFEEGMKNPKVSKKQIKFIKEAIKQFELHPF